MTSAIDGDSPRQDPAEEHTPRSLGIIDSSAPWIEYAVQQARIAQKTVQSTVDSAVDVTRSRIDRILTTSSAHFNQTVDSLQDLKAEYSAYEDVAVGKVKEGVLLAVSNPLITTGAVVGVGFLGLKKVRKLLHYKTVRLFFSEEALLSRADARIKELRQSTEFLKQESETLEKRALQAEEDLLRGRTKLRQAGKQIQSVINSAYKIERQAGGLKDILKELPSREASRFRTQVANLAKEAKKERAALSKEVTKISNHGIPV